MELERVMMAFDHTDSEECWLRYSAELARMLGQLLRSKRDQMNLELYMPLVAHRIVGQLGHQLALLYVARPPYNFRQAGWARRREAGSSGSRTGKDVG
jgi:hypothetical protein